MEINKKELLEALEIVKPGLANREIIEQSTSFAFMQDRIVTYNDELSISHPVSGLEINGAIKADELYKLLSKLKADELSIDITETEVRITSGKAKAGMTLQSEIKLPIEDIGAIGKWKDLPSNFIEAVKFILPACSSDMSRPVLTCVHISANGFIEGADTNKIAKHLLDKATLKTVLIPAHNMQQIVRLNPTKIAEGAGWIHFKTEKGTVISSRIFEDDSFPDTKSHFVEDGIQLILPKTLGEILERASVFKTESMGMDTVEITISEKKINVKSMSDTGWFEESAPIRFQGDTIRFTISPIIIKDILSRGLNCTISDRIIQFEDADWVYLCALTSVK